MTRAFSSILTISFVVGIVGCGPSPEKVCDHLVKLSANSDREKAKKFGESRGECVSVLTALKDSDSDKFEQYATCALEESESFIFAAQTCSTEAGMKPHIEDRVAP